MGLRPRARAAPLQNFTSWVDLVDCSVLCIERNSKGALLLKDIRRNFQGLQILLI